MNRMVLKDIGLTEGEVKVYFALFELGDSTVGPISKKSGVTHAKTYPVLNKLIEKGLASHVIRAGRKHFSATSPDNLLEFVNRKIRNLEEEKEQIKDIIPSLLAKQKEKEKTQYSRVFEGMKGLKSLFYELFSGVEEKAEICVFGLNEVLKRTDVQNFFLFYHALRRKHKISLKLILNTRIKKLFKRFYEPTGYFKSKYEQVKFIDLVYPVGVFIFKDHVINIMADEKVTAFDIKSKQNAERYRKFFYSMWNKK